LKPLLGINNKTYNFERDDFEMKQSDNLKPGESIFNRITRFFYLCVFISIILALTGAGFLGYVIKLVFELPDTAQVKAMSAPNGIALDYSQMPDFISKALVASCDENFYLHKGLDMEKLKIFAQKTYKNESIELSDRTITQNLAAIALKTPLENSGRLFNELGTFLKECLLSYKLESKLKSKDKILEIYFNNALFGENITGILQASSIYFNKRPAELSENECVTLTAILKTPGKLQSKNSVETLKSAKQSIIKKMTASKLIDENKGRELDSMRTKMYIPAEIEL